MKYLKFIIYVQSCNGEKTGNKSKACLLIHHHFSWCQINTSTNIQYKISPIHILNCPLQKKLNYKKIIQKNKFMKHSPISKLHHSISQNFTRHSKNIIHKKNPLQKSAAPTNRTSRRIWTLHFKEKEPVHANSVLPLNPPSQFS